MSDHLPRLSSEFRIRQLDGSHVEITAADAIAALGHDL